MMPHATRTASIIRRTGETDISLSLCLDGQGKAEINTGVGFFDHMLTTLARHGGLDLNITVKGDLHIDDHHTIEDVGIALGEAFYKAIGNKRGIERFGHALVPLDEALCEAVVDISGRPFLAFRINFPREMIGGMATEMVEEFFRAFAMSARITVHLTNKTGTNAHHISESGFKSFARALRMAITRDPRAGEAIPSTKGIL